MASNLATDAAAAAGPSGSPRAAAAAPAAASVDLKGGSKGAVAPSPPTSTCLSSAGDTILHEGSLSL